MAAAENLRAGCLLEERHLHLGREIATAAGWRVIRDITTRSTADGAIVVDVYADEPLVVWPHRHVSVRNRTPLDAGNCFGVYSRGLILETHPDRDSADFAAHDPADSCSTSSHVVLVCPVHPEHITDGFCPDCTDADLPAVVKAEDDAEGRGLTAGQRRTCHTCHTWATPEHLAGRAHRIATPHLANRRNHLPNAA
ncbi:hypothetical protein KBX50_08455 [Micromonospora sp. C51]|uniref:hypothetical protein n=1 Tax=Micromonospora sp. C51 TaxID=2824879 RepID=UPI001B37E2BB|nr:hypothetical protein [Micromonospora sp. C51]MBQ1048494.1 hypothetical protein [Micromonospora sp. C51]